MNPRVSILLPNYNNAEYLDQCFESILNQTISDFEVVIVDDGSTDNSIEIINRYLSDGRFKLFIKDENSGIVDSLNHGLGKVQGEYLVRLDGDDYMAHDRIEKLLKCFELDPNLDICGSQIRCFGQADKLISYPSDSILNHANLIFGHSVGHATCMFRTKLFEESGVTYSNEFKYMEDYNLFYDLKSVSKTTSIPEELYFYRVNELHEDHNLIERKRDTYLAFYKMILKDLDMYEEGLEQLHFELAKNLIPSRTAKRYKSHIETILKCNSMKKLYPHKELEIVLKRNLNQILHRLMDNQKASLSDVMWSPKLLKYYLRTRK